MGGLEESYVTRKPLEFTLIVLVVILILLIPVYFYSKYQAEKRAEEAPALITETFEEVNYWFGPDSELTENDKRMLFKINYAGNLVQWSGNMIECTPLNGIYRAGISHTGSEFADVVFTTEDDCTTTPIGDRIYYRMRLVEWKIRSYIGESGEILG